ncbi:DUF5710 domain-containing protein [Streptomyces sp. NPDC058665]|uniref:DUF5710 domain-containing protein n=1 Tax=Streptomyces sp. NPDC058665 TaxID=3346586 RepID=UPI00364DACE3
MGAQVGRPGRFQKPKLHGSHAQLNEALHELHRGAGLLSLGKLAEALKGADVKRSTIYDAFSSSRLPAWHVVDALVEILATRDPRTTPEDVLPRFHGLWLLAVEEEDSAEDVLSIRLTGNTVDSGNPDLAALAAAGSSAIVSAMATEAWEHMRKRTHELFQRRYAGRIWLSVPYGLKDRVKEHGGRWDADYRLWFIEEPVPELMQYQVPAPMPPGPELGNTAKG